MFDKSIKVDDEWIVTQVIWLQKQPLCQLCHKHCFFFLYFFIVLIDNYCQKMYKKLIIS